MIIRNAIIVVDGDDAIQMAPEELAGFTGNVVFNRAKLSADLLARLDEAVHTSADEDSATTDARWATVKKKLVG